MCDVATVVQHILDGMVWDIKAKIKHQGTIINMVYGTVVRSNGNWTGHDICCWY